MKDDDLSAYVIPTELERTDGFWDLSALALAALAVWYGMLNGIPPWGMLVLVLPVAAWTLTGEPTADVPYIGAVAAGLRSQLGQRRAHEWLLAWWHYFVLIDWPRITAYSAACYRSSRQHLTRWRRQPSAPIRWTRSRVSSWGSRIPSNSSLQHVRRMFTRTGRSRLG